MQPDNEHAERHAPPSQHAHSHSSIKCCHFPRTARFVFMLLMVISYFFVEIIVGYIANSLAMVADSFHMLSDFLALIIALISHRISSWPRSSSNTFGWQRADVVGSLINTVVLATLCFSIFTQAVKKFFHPEHVNNPKLLVIVGSFGLLINLIGLVVFSGSHGHSHGGGGGHSHDAVAPPPVSDATTVGGDHTRPKHTREQSSGVTAAAAAANKDSERGPLLSTQSDLTEPPTANQQLQHQSQCSDAAPDQSQQQQQQHSTLYTESNLVAMEDDVIVDDEGVQHHVPCANVSAPPIAHPSGKKAEEGGVPDCNIIAPSSANANANLATNDGQVTVVLPANKQRSNQKNVQSLKAIFLHVLADALGSVIVIISALLIWLVPDSNSDSFSSLANKLAGNVSRITTRAVANNSAAAARVIGRVAMETTTIASAAAGESRPADWKLYVDPIMSILLVIIILVSTCPLIKQNALILLQSVPKAINIRQLKAQVQEIQGIIDLHDLHVWQLQSDVIIGTAHIKCGNLPDYIEISKQVKQLFHNFDIHCTTVQPEFEEHLNGVDSAVSASNRLAYNATASSDCVLECAGPNKTCKSSDCCPVSPNSNSTSSSAGVMGGTASLRTPYDPPSLATSGAAAAAAGGGGGAGGGGSNNNEKKSNPPAGLTSAAYVAPQQQSSSKNSKSPSPPAVVFK